MNQFIEVIEGKTPTLINLAHVIQVFGAGIGTVIVTSDEASIEVKETYDEVKALIKDRLGE